MHRASLPEAVPSCLEKVHWGATCLQVVELAAAVNKPNPRFSVTKPSHRPRLTFATLFWSSLSSYTTVTTQQAIKNMKICIQTRKQFTRLDIKAKESI